MANSNFRTLRADYIDGVNVTRSYIKNNSGGQGLTGWILYNDAYLLTSTDTVGDAINIRNVSTGTTVAPYVGQPLYYTGTTPSGGLTLNTVYYVASTPTGAGTTASPWYFQISATRGGSPINLTSTAGDSNSRFLPYQPMGAIGNAVATSNTLAVSTTDPLNDVSNFLYTKAASITLGEGYRYDFTIARSDKYKVLQIDLDYQIASGTYATGDLSIYIIDTSTNTVIQPSAFQIENVGIEYSSSLTFQTSGGTNYRLCIHNSSISSAAYTLKSANYRIGKQVLTVGQLRGPVGSVIYTGSAVAAPGYLAAHGTAVSRTEYAKLFAVIGTTFGVGDGSTTFNLPDLRGIFARGAGSQVIGGQTFTGVLGTKTGDSTARPNTAFTTGTESANHTHNLTAVSTPVWNSAGGNIVLAANNNINTSYASGTQSANHTHTVTGGGDAETAPANIGLNVYICFDAGDTIISSSADTRVVAVRLTSPSAGSFSALTNVSFSSTTIDTHGMVTSADTLTVKVPGTYKIGAALLTGTLTQGATGAFEIYYRINTGGHIRIGWVSGNGAAGVNYFASGSDTVDLVAGDIINFRVSSSATATLNSGHIFVEKIQGPTQIAASEVIAVNVYRSASTQSVPHNTDTTLIMDTKEVDTHNAYNTSTGVFTAPADGLYKASGFTRIELTGGSATYMYCYFQKQGSGVRSQTYTYATSTTTEFSVGASDLVPLKTGETYTFRVAQFSTAAGNTSPTAWQTYFNIHRLGGII